MIFPTDDCPVYLRCQLGLQQVTDLIPWLEKKPETNWQRMLNAIWIGELAMKCGNTEMAEKYLNEGLEKSKKIYKKDSMGQKQIIQRVKELLN